MSFTCPIKARKRYGLDVVRVDVPLTVLGLRGPMQQKFVLDTGCEITMVSEDVAARLGLTAGGRRVNLVGATAGGTGRLVDVRFRFPTTVSGYPGLEVESTWVVVKGGQSLALLGFMEVHRHFCIRTLEFDMYFIPWTSLRGG